MSTKAAIIALVCVLMVSYSSAQPSNQTQIIGIKIPSSPSDWSKDQVDDLINALENLEVCKIYVLRSTLYSTCKTLIINYHLWQAIQLYNVQTF